MAVTGGVGTGQRYSNRLSCIKGFMQQQQLFCLFSMLEFMLAYLLPLCLP